MPVPGLSMPNRRSRPSRPSDRLGIGPPAGAASCQKEFPVYLPLAFGRSSAVFGNIGPAEHQQEGDSQIKRRDDGIDLKGDRKSTRMNSSHSCASRMPSSA